jgi:hypothetical protein
MSNSNPSQTNYTELLQTLEKRFEKNINRHPDLKWEEVQKKLEKSPTKLQTLSLMEETGGEPDVIGYDPKTKEYIFCDCSTESQKGRRSLCYDEAALKSRKEYKPKGSALGMAEEMGVEMLNEEQYKMLQELGDFDNKTSSWVTAPDSVRNRGGGLFGDKRYGRTFIYHNGAESYYASRGFRAIIRV